MHHLLIILTLLLSSALTARADIISIRADMWCPYNCNPDDKKPGYGIEIVNTIFENAGHQIDYGLLTWADSIARTRKGEFTAIIGATSHDAPDFVFPDELIGKSSISYVVRADNPATIQSVADLNGKRLGVIDAYSYNPAVDDYIDTHKLDAKSIAVSKGDDALDFNIAKLLSKRLDVICDDTNVLYYKTNKIGLFNQVKMSRDNSKLTPIYLAFSPVNPKATQYAAIFDKGMMELRRSGKLKDILQQYGLVDWE